jgi:putative membrane-bound dehydrogenase-like protein
MPWREGIAGRVINAARQQNERAEGQRAMWVDVGMQVEGRTDQVHIAVFDHPSNAGFPQPWRVDGQLGIGPVRARMGDWTIPAGGAEVIRHRLYVYTGEKTDIALTEAWEAFSGNEGMYSTAALWGIAQQEGLDAEFLTPEAAADRMTVKAGYRVNAWAGEPMITQPMAFAWDDRGRMWVAENRDYESRGTGFSNSGDSRILILEDTDRDGAADSRKVFLEGIPFPSAIAVGFDGLYLGAPPNLLFVPDRNQDDVADADIQILLSGWGIRDRHETINSLHWGPDGWLYGLEGFATPSKIRKPGAGDRIYRPGEAFPEDLLEKDGVDIDGGVWRYHPVKDRFEVVAHGFSNPWGIDYDAKGQLFISACVIPHAFHVIPGGVYMRQGGRHFNPYVYSDIQPIVDHRHRSAHGGARVYQSDAFPADQQGRLFMANIHEHAVLTDVLTPNGSGFTAGHGEDFLLANNAAWIGFSMEIGPEGAVYVLDWHDGDICGKDVFDKDTGRIFRIAPDSSLAQDWEGRYDDLRTKSDLDLVRLQRSPSDWHARRARVILQHRATQRPLGETARQTLYELFDDISRPEFRLKALWTMHVAGLASPALLLEALEDRDEYVRAWAIQLLTEDLRPSEEALERFGSLARLDRSPVVRKYLAAALQRIDKANRWDIAEGLASHARDAGDPNIPLLIWFGLEPLVADDPVRALDLAARANLPIVAEFVARRTADAGAFEPLFAALEDHASARTSMLDGLRDALYGRTDLVEPAGWADLYTRLQRDRRAAPLAVEIAQLFGDAEAVKALVASLANPAAAVDERRRAIDGLANHRRPELAAVLPGLLDDAGVRTHAIRAVAAYDDAALGRQLLDRYAGFDASDRTEALLALASRPSHGQVLTQAIAEGAVPRGDVPAFVARQLRQVVGNGFVEVWGPIDDLALRNEAAFRKYRALLTDEALAGANPEHGAAIFQRTCGACHVMNGAGGNVGPDLTGSNRTNLEYLLSNILRPSEVIQDDYRLVVVTTQDGRTYMGNRVSETAQTLTLRVVGQGDVVVDRSAIRSVEESTASLMPEGLLDTLTDAEVLDLVAFLRGVAS